MTRQPLPPKDCCMGAGPAPSEPEARAKLAAELAHGDVAKFTALLRLPLFDVALNGSQAL